jgi:putative acetyltransferase
MSAPLIDVAVRPATPADAEAIAETVTAAFGREDEAKLVAALAASGDIAGSFVAEHADAVIGHILFSRLDAPFPALALAPVSVRPGHQHRGAGSALIRHGLSWAYAQDWAAVFVLGEPGYYGRFGFDAAAAESYECAYAGPYLMAKFFREPPAPRGTLIYPAPFSELE